MSRLQVQNPPPSYDPDDQRNLRSAMVAADAKNLKRDEPIVTLNVVNFDTGARETIQWTNAGWAVV